MALFGGRKNPPGENVLFFDIGNASIGVAVAHVSSEKTSLEFARRIPIAFQKEIDAQRFMMAARAALESACHVVMDDYVKKQKKVLHATAAHCFFSSPWLLSKPISVRYEPGRQFSLTHDLIEHVRTEEERRFAAQFTKEGEKSKASIIEEHIIGAQINGYKVKSVDGQRGTNLVLQTFFSAASREATKTFESIIENNLHVHDVSFASFLFAYYRTITILFPDIADFICIDITGEVTDIIIVRDGIIMSVLSFPIGVHSVRRSIVTETGMPDDAAHTIQTIAADERSAPPTSAQKAVADGINRWSDELKNVLASVSTNIILPRSLFVAIDEDVAPPFLNALNGMDYDALGITKDHFNVTHFTKDRTAPQIEVSAGTNDDPFIRISALFVRDATEKGSNTHVFHEKV